MFWFALVPGYFHFIYLSWDRGRVVVFPGAVAQFSPEKSKPQGINVWRRALGHLDTAKGAKMAINYCFVSDTCYVIPCNAGGVCGVRLLCVCWVGRLDWVGCAFVGSFACV